MQTLKRILAGTFAVTMAFGAAACGSSSTDDSSEYEQQVEVEDTDVIEAIPEGAESELLWLSYFDLNPASGSEEKSTELELFEKKGGTITYEQTTSMTKFDTLAERVLANDVPDMFWYEASMCYPSYCIKGMFQPIDSIVDFEDDLWADVAETAEQFTLKGEHYVAPITYVANSVLTYDKDVIEANALDDPYELYLEGEWDWDAWYDMMEDYVNNAEGDEIRYGVNGWFQDFIFYSTGETIVEYDEENDEYVNNITNANFDRASTLLYNIQKNGLYLSEWIGQTSDCFKENCLFYAMGPWASSTTHTPDEDDNWGMVPMPRDPEADAAYITVETDAYLWIAGSTKSEAMKCWLECAKLANTDESYKEVAKEKFFVTNPYWTEDMYQVAYEEYMSDNWVRIVDPGFGISNTLSNDNAATNDTKEAVISYLYAAVMYTDEDGSQYTWTQLRESYTSTIDSELADFNEEYHEFINSD
ncbi:MAG: extracellular solute-binding protein [Ruminococcus sp.]|nr:extracellular solute-binding protein [Ruminococcus sp.]